MREQLKKYKFLTCAIVLLWINIYIVSKLYFTNLTFDNKMQNFIFFISPLSTVLFVLGISLFFKEKRRNRYILISSFLMTFILYANVVFYRFYGDFITIPVLFQTNNMGHLGSSIFNLMKPFDIFVFTGFVLLLFLKKKLENKEAGSFRKTGLLILAFSVAFFFFNLHLSEKQRPELLTRAFDRQMLVKNIGVLNSQVYDAIIQTRTKTQKTFANSDQLTNIQNYVKSSYIAPNPDLYGAAKGKNVIVVSLESTQSFLIGKQVNGQEVTPFLNSLVNDSYYFDNIYHQTGQGKTSDAEFLIENSLYPLSRGAVFFTHPQNHYEATPQILSNYGYTSAVFHANDESFWNRNVMYNSIGYNKYFSKPYYTVTEENSVGWGLKDKEFFDQSMSHLQSLKQPFYSKFIMLTNHFPFTINPEDQMLDLGMDATNDNVVNRYFQTVRYEDEALKHFFELLKQSGLYDNSVIVLYGDHYGISTNHNEAMSQVMGKEITPFDTTQLQRVPLFIHVPGVKGSTVHTVGGQVDIRPTLLHLLGVPTNDQIQFGHDLLSKNHPEFAVFRDGSFVTKDAVYTEDTCYDKTTGKQTNQSLCQPYFDKAKTELEYSDKIIYGDLLRFYKKK